MSFNARQARSDVKLYMPPPAGDRGHSLSTDAGGYRSPSVRQSHCRCCRSTGRRVGCDHSPGSTTGQHQLPFLPLSPFPEPCFPRNGPSIGRYSASWNKFGVCKCTGEGGRGAGHEREGTLPRQDSEPAVHGPPGRAGAEERRLEARIM